MASEIRAALENELGKTRPFISNVALQSIWNKDSRLERFMDSAFGVVESRKIRIVREQLLKTLSLLVYIEPRESGRWWRTVKSVWIDNLGDSAHMDQWLAAHTTERLKQWLQCTEWTNRFLQSRDIFTAIVVSEGMTYDLRERPGRAPYMEKSRILGEGRNGNVIEREILPGHLLLFKNGQFREVKKKACVAVKKLRISSKNHEIGMLEQIRDITLNNQDNIATHLAVLYNQDRQSVDVLYPVADGGDLNGLIENTSLLQAKSMTAFIDQMINLASALKFLHRECFHSQACCHMDLKPKNVLVFGLHDIPSSVGHWKLADFGASRILALRSQSSQRPGASPHDYTYTVNTKPQVQFGRYQAPEIERNEETGAGRGSDIWSLGCIFVDVLASKLGVLSQLKSATYYDNNGDPYKNGCFYCTYTILPFNISWGSGYCLKEGVREWIENEFYISRHGVNRHDKIVLRNLSQLLQLMLNVDKIKRPGADKVYKGFKSLATISNPSDESYSTSSQRLRYRR
ncbi:kinase-like domain-containing protein [Xylariaceae sp. FL0255]|nr:kinase-like domain-containing protein [Xylariaceae sp. FL0255]